MQASAYMHIYQPFQFSLYEMEPHMHISFLKLLDVQGFFAIYVESNVVINYPL